MLQATDQPGVWADPDWQAGTPGTFAVIIGVSHYDHLAGSAAPAADTYGLGQLYVSALTAYRFFDWLRSRYRYDGSPLARCWLLLSPSPAEVALEPGLAANPLAPTLAACTQAVRDWFSAMQQLPQPAAAQSRSFFFFSGHGLEQSLEQQILLPCDYLRPQGILNDAIGTANLFRGMASLAVPHQFFFLDACRNDHQRLREEEDLSGQSVLGVKRSAYANSTRVAPLFYASASGSQAWQPRQPADGPSMFGQALLEALCCEAGFRPQCAAELCTIQVFSLQMFLKNRVLALLRERQTTVSQQVRLGGISDDVPIAQVAVPKGPDLGDHFGGLLVSPIDTSHALDHWTIAGSNGAGQPLAHDLFGSERMTAIWANARLYSFAQRDWLNPHTAIVLHRVDRAETLLYQIALSVAGPPGSYWLELSDSVERFACLLPLARPSTRYQIEIDYEYTQSDEPRRISRLEASLDRENEGMLGTAEQLWARYNAQNAALAASKIDLDFARDALAGKLTSPLAAIVGALILLRAQRLDLLHDWLANLTGWFPEVPEGPVLWAEQQLRAQGEEFSRAEAVRLLGELLARGLPQTSDGLSYAARQADDLWEAADPEDGQDAAEQAERQRLRDQVAPVRARLHAALRHLRGGGLFCVFAGTPQTLTPALVAGA